MIREVVTRTNDDAYETRKKMERQSLQETSKARVKNWPNTMEALRLKREEDRIQRLEDEEVSYRGHNTDSWCVCFAVHEVGGNETVSKHKFILNVIRYYLKRSLRV